MQSILGGLSKRHHVGQDIPWNCVLTWNVYGFPFFGSCSRKAFFPIKASKNKIEKPVEDWKTVKTTYDWKGEHCDTQWRPTGKNSWHSYPNAPQNAHQSSIGI